MLDLRNIDCMKLMAEYPDKHFDIAIVDPPYGIDRAEWDNRPTAEYWKELFRVSKEQIVFGGNYFGLPITENWLCWDKTNNGKSFFKHKAKFELIWLSIETKPDLIRTSGKTFSHNVQVNTQHVCPCCLELPNVLSEYNQGAITK